MGPSPAITMDGIMSCRFFEDVMRKNSSSPNMLMESLHLKRFADEGSRQAAAAAEGAAAAAAAGQAAGRAAFRDGLKNKMATARSDKANKLQRDEAVHAAILRHQVTSQLKCLQLPAQNYHRKHCQLCSVNTQSVAKGRNI